MLTEFLQNLLNRNLSQSPRARALCAELAGRGFTVTLDGAGLRYFGSRYLVASNGHLLSISTASPDVTAAADVRGSPLQLLALAGPDPQQVIRRGDVRIEGDAELVERYRELLRLLRPDLEEDLSLLVGDSAAYRIGQAARGVLRFGRRSVETTTRNVAEFLAHEQRDLVPRGEAEAWFGDVDLLREDTDRLAARVSLLAAQRPPR